MPKPKAGYAPAAVDDEDVEYGDSKVHRSRSGSSWYTTQAAVAAAALVIFIFISEPIVVVPAGHSAIVDFFGHVGDTIPSGMHFKTLFAATHFFSLKTRLVDVTQDSPTSEGLIVELGGGDSSPHPLLLSTQLITSPRHRPPPPLPSPSSSVLALCYKQM